MILHLAALLQAHDLSVHTLREQTAGDRHATLRIARTPQRTA